jgi:phosphoenolpyruvate synthase/pyruvate phosphate dikinase
MTYVLWLDDAGAETGALVGGKFSSLAEMTAAGFGVPRAFAVTTDALAAFMIESGLEHDARAVHTDVAAGAVIQQRILETPLPAAVAAEVTAAYARLCDETGVDDVPVAVRSSGVAEDLAGASFAGQYETYLWIRGADSVLEHVRRCWTGLFGEAVLSYRPGGGVGDASMAVVVQQLVQPRAAGVLFTLDPVNGDRSKIAIEASWGLGEAVVAGEVTPDRFRVDKVTLDVVERAVSEKDVEYRWHDGVVTTMPVPAERRGLPSLGDDDLRALAELAKRIERHRGAPQDVEWAIDDSGTVHVLQVRPETVWSTREAKPVATPGKSAVELVLGSFLKGKT